MHIIEIDLPILETTISVFNICPTGTQGFHLRPGEYNPGLHGLIDMIIMECLFIFTDYFHGL